MNNDVHCCCSRRRRRHRRRSLFQVVSVPEIETKPAQNVKIPIIFMFHTNDDVAQANKIYYLYAEAAPGASLRGCRIPHFGFFLFVYRFLTKTEKK